jgi:hypothetical protein
VVGEYVTALPETATVLRPTARIVWRREPESTEPPSLGMRFMRLDGESAGQLSRFVHERYASPL